MAVTQCVLSIVMLDAVACYRPRRSLGQHDPAAAAAGDVAGAVDPDNENLRH